MRNYLKRALARRTYRAWFYAPNCTETYAVKRLKALGFQWTGWRWVPPRQEVFIRRVMQ